MNARRRGSAATAVLLAGLIGAGCGGGDPSHPAARPSGPVRCETGFDTPEGFTLGETVRVRAPGHVGIRQAYRDELGRTLHATSGIAGEFGEGGRTFGTLTVASGEEATLYGGGDAWVLVWQVTSVCTPHTVSGSGFTREGFLAAIESADLVHPAAAMGVPAGEEGLEGQG